MNIAGIKPYSNPAFKAHFYNCRLENENLHLKSIITDNNPNLGNKPEIIITDGFGYEKYHVVDVEDAKPIKMRKTKKGNFIAKAHDFLSEYKIFYKDTGLTDDNNGKNYDFSKKTFDKFTKQAVIASKKAHNHPLTSIISAGEVSGKLVVCDDISKLPPNFDKETPTILMSRHSKDYNPFSIPKNVVGIILENGSAGALYHLNSELRNMFDAVAITYDEKEIQKLETLNNQFINFSTLNKKIHFKKTDKPKSAVKNTLPKIEIPKMRYIDTLVESKDYELNTVGPKAYRLKIMEELASKGVLKDVKIPKSFAVTHGFIDKMFEPIKGTEELYPPSDSPQIEEIKNKIKQLDINGDWLMFRSSFNGEDVANYSAAGLYRSLDGDIDSLEYYLTDVILSKNSHKATASRKLYGIPDEAIKPTVIIQELIMPDYGFTIYTKDSTENDDILTINMNTKQTSESKDPYIIQYNKKNKELKVIAFERDTEYLKFDEQGNIIASSYGEDKLLKSWDNMRPILQKVVDNALALEEHFGYAQDIEGGIKGNQIYFWQTRNITRKF